MKKLLGATLIGFFLLGVPVRALSRDTGPGQANEKLKKTEQFPKILAQKMLLQKLQQSGKYEGVDFDLLRSLPAEAIDSMIKKYQPGPGAKPSAAPATIRSTGEITYVPLIIDAPPVSGEIPSGEQDYWKFTVVNDGYYGIQVWLDNLYWVTMSLYGPNDPAISLEEADNCDMSFFMIYRFLSAGTYYVKIDCYPQNTGTYSINVVSVLAWGGISGRVTNSSGVGIQGLYVFVYGNSTDYRDYYGAATTDVRGNYMVSGPYRNLATGSYKVYFYKNGLDYLSEWYNDKSSIETADLVAVTSGGVTQNINAQLASGNRISGRVTDGSGVGIQGIEVDVYSPARPDYNNFCSYAETDADGNYTVWGLPAGDLKVFFYNNGKNYASEWYDNKNSFSTADPVTVTAGSDVSGIDAQMSLGDCISGRVTNSSGAGVRYVTAWVFDLDFNDFGWGRTDACGNYMVKGLPPGQYKLFFTDDWDGYFMEWYKNKGDFALADSVSVVAGSTTSHVDIQLTSIITNPTRVSAWQKGGAYSIKWQKQGEQNAYVKIQLLKGTSTLVRSLAVKTENDGSFDWKVPDTVAVGSNYFIKVRTIDNLDSGDSDKFSIIVPAIIITAPASGAVWVKNDTKTITWNKLGMQDANVMIQLYKGSAKAMDITLSAANNGSYDWFIPATLANGPYTMRITTLDGRVRGISKLFTIVSGIIRVNQPATGVAWYRGMPWDISWTTEGAVNPNVRIQLNRGATKVRDISTGTPTAGGSCRWTIPAAQAVAGNYSITVTALDNLARGKTGSFSILSGAMDISQPSAGAVWQRGSTHAITWAKTGDLINANVRILLVRGTTVVSTLMASTPNDGSCEWSIPAGQAPAANYKVRILTVDNLVRADSGVFTIANTAGLALLSPNGNEKLDAATAQTIRWSHDPEVLEVKLELSRDNGGSFTTIADHVPNMASYNWPVPVNFTANGLVRVSDRYGKSWLHEGGVLEYTLNFYPGSREEAARSDFSLWFGSADAKAPGFGFARVTIGHETVRLAGATKASEPLIAGWHEAKIRLDLKNDLGTLFIDGRPELENVALYTSRVRHFEPYLSIQTGGDAPADLLLGGVTIQVVLLAADGSAQERFTVLNEDFSGYDAERNRIGSCWQVLGLNAERSVLELETLPGKNRALRLRSLDGGTLTIVKKLSIPGTIPFDISDRPFTIEMRQAGESSPD